MLIFGKLVLRNHFPKSVLTKSIRDDSAPSFTIQILSKSLKIFPTMIMGWFTTKKIYDRYEWLHAFVIAMGFVLFMFENGSDDCLTTSHSALKF